MSSHVRRPQYHLAEARRFDQISYYIYEVDEKNGSADVLTKFAPNRPIMLHRHKASYRTFVVQGELRIYRRTANLKEVRPVGSYVISDANGEPQPKRRRRGGHRSLQQPQCRRENLRISRQ